MPKKSAAVSNEQFEYDLREAGKDLSYSLLKLLEYDLAAAMMNIACAMVRISRHMGPAGFKAVCDDIERLRQNSRSEASKPDGADAPEQADGLQQPHDNKENHQDLDDAQDPSVHGDEADEVQHHTNDDEHNQQ